MTTKNGRALIRPTHINGNEVDYDEVDGINTARVFRGGHYLLLTIFWLIAAFGLHSIFDITAIVAAGFATLNILLGVIIFYWLKTRSSH